MDDYLSKPLKRDALQALLAQWLTQDNIAPSTAAETTSSEVEKAETAEETPTESPIDLEHLEMFTDGDADEERELFEMFMEQATLNMKELRESLGDNEDWRKAAHKFKGSAANMGAAALAASCKIAEDEFAATLDEKNQYLADVTAQLQQVENFIEQRIS